MNQLVSAGQDIQQRVAGRIAVFLRLPQFLKAKR